MWSTPICQQKPQGVHPPRHLSSPQPPFELGDYRFVYRFGLTVHLRVLNRTGGMLDTELFIKLT